MGSVGPPDPKGYRHTATVFAVIFHALRIANKAFQNAPAKMHHFENKSPKIFWGGAQTPPPIPQTLPVVGRGYPPPHTLPHRGGSHSPWTPLL